MKTRTTSVQREANGQYTDGIEAMCKCGKRKGEHMAVRPWDCEETDCLGFKKAK